MSLMKTTVDEKIGLSYLQNNFDENIKTMDFISGGELSQAFSFVSNNQNFIIKANRDNSSFVKDKYAFDNFSSEKTHIPKVIKISEMYENLYFCITEKIEGKTIDRIDEKVQAHLYPLFIEILDAIHSVKLTPGKYGWWEGQGVAKFSSWREYILNGMKEAWEEFYKTTFLEKNLIEKMLAEMEKLVDKLPEGRFLIHGDFGGNNALSDGNKITGIIDWGNSAYGDFLFDVAYQEFWVGGGKLSNVYQEHYIETGWDIKNYDARIRCYLLYIGIGVLTFWARAGLEDNYKMSKKRVLEYLNPF